jgi:hypothetical protein
MILFYKNQKNIINIQILFSPMGIHIEYTKELYIHVFLYLSDTSRDVER